MVTHGSVQETAHTVCALRELVIHTERSRDLDTQGGAESASNLEGVCGGGRPGCGGAGADGAIESLSMGRSSRWVNAAVGQPCRSLRQVEATASCMRTERIDVACDLVMLTGRKLQASECPARERSCTPAERLRDNEAGECNEM